MKIKHYLVSVILTLPTLSAMAQRTPEHPFDFPKTGWEKFVTALDNWSAGQPYDNCSKMDDEFFISRVRPRTRIVDGDYTAVTGVDKDRKMCLWVPLDDPTVTWKAFPRYSFEGDNFSMWQYIDIHGNWTAPWARVSANMSDAAHRNGVKVGCVLSIPYGQQVTWSSWYGSGYGGLFRTLTQKENGTFKYARKLVEFMKYYGIDGLGCNSEFHSSSRNMADLIDFFAECHKIGKEIGWDFQLHWYDGTNGSGYINFDQGLGSHNESMFGKADNITTDMLFFNYNTYNELITSSVAKAEAIGRSPYDLYVGFDIQGNALRSRNNLWQALKDNKISIGFWGAHAQSLLHQSATDDGSSDIAIQRVYQKKLELLFSGGNNNPAVLPAFNNNCNLANASLKHFHGMAHFLSAKSTITEIPFVSRFNLGNGLKFYNDGKVAYDHKWYNLGTQDLLPTWRWWITNSNDQATTADLNSFIKADLSFDDAYFGGSSLKLSGATPYSRIKLFKTLLRTQPNYTLSITYKTKGNATTHAKLFVSLKNKITEYKEVSIPNNDASINNWYTYTTTLSELGLQANDEVAMIGLVVENSDANYEMSVGELALRNPGQTFNTPQPEIKEIQVLRGRYNAFDFKLRYASKDESDGTRYYNEDLDTWYYEIFCQQKDQDEILLTATPSWAAYVIDAPLVGGKDARKVRFGVRAVSPDGKQKTNITWTEYKEIEYNQPINDIVSDKVVIKANEEFTLSLKDILMETPQKWVLKNNMNDHVVATAENTATCTAKIVQEGLYDLYVTDSKGVETVIRGKVQVTPTEVGSVPDIEDIVVDKNEVKIAENVTLSFIGRKGEGSVSRAVEISDPQKLMIPASVQTNRTYSYALWFKADKFSHDKQGTNLINKNSIADSWPHNNWGDLWVVIRPAEKDRPENLVAFNTMGWTEHDNPNSMMLSAKTSGSSYATQKVTGPYYQVSPGIWYHVVVTQEETLQKMYFNGVLVAQDNFANSTRREDLASKDGRIRPSNPADIFIGGGGVYKAGFNGAVDEVQIWNKALSEEEVKRAMKGYSESEIPEGLQAYYTFETKNADGSFPNLGKAGADKVAKIVMTEGSGGENTSSAAHKQQNSNNDLLGCPGIKGSLPITATAKWTSGANSAEGDNAVVRYNLVGRYDVTLTLENNWAKTQMTKTEAITIVDESTNIDAVEATQAEISIINENGAILAKFAKAGAYTIEVINTAGAILQRDNLNVSDNQSVGIDINKGIYILRISKEGKTIKTLKLSK